MATEKAKAEVSDNYNDSIQDTSMGQQQAPDGKEPRKSNFGKALAHRALYGSGSRHAGSRKERTNDASRTLPSRLSKVSLADDTEN
ncbi:hypothetical protein OWV82_000807 [Melia azedarach]|uniref:Uncharacterized protein n=1 Tax=Melia azedarach TaxID=155640 RepID=A0ACC1YVP9_MELAZ|nr:hypothetical protein OWV82_000807 [Melia azedarach]